MIEMSFWLMASTCACSRFWVSSYCDSRRLRTFGPCSSHDQRLLDGAEHVLQENGAVLAESQVLAGDLLDLLVGGEGLQLEDLRAELLVKGAHDLEDGGSRLAMVRFAGRQPAIDLGRELVHLHEQGQQTRDDLVLPRRRRQHIGRVLALGR